MSIKFGSIVVLIVFLFVAKISIENFNSAQAKETNIAQTRLK